MGLHSGYGPRLPSDRPPRIQLIGLALHWDAEQSAQRDGRRVYAGMRNCGRPGSGTTSPTIRTGTTGVGPPGHHGGRSARRRQARHSSGHSGASLPAAGCWLFQTYHSPPLPSPLRGLLGTTPSGLSLTGDLPWTEQSAQGTQPGFLLRQLRSPESRRAARRRSPPSDAHGHARLAAPLWPGWPRSGRAVPGWASPWARPWPEP